MKTQASQYQLLSPQEAKRILLLLKDKVQNHQQVQVLDQRSEDGTKFLSFKFEGEIQQIITRQSRKRTTIAEQESLYEEEDNSNVQNLRLNHEANSRKQQQIKQHEQCKETLDKKQQQQQQDNEPNQPNEEQQKPRQAKNIIKNLVNGFKKFPRSLGSGTILRIINGEKFEPNSIKIQRLIRNWKKNTILAQFQTQYRQLFGQDLIETNQPQIYPQKKEKIKYNKSLIEEIFRIDKFRVMFKFWLINFAQHYIVYGSKIKYGAQAEHRIAVQDLIEVLSRNHHGKSIRCPSFRHEMGPYTLQDPQQSYLIKKSNRNFQIQTIEIKKTELDAELQNNQSVALLQNKRRGLRDCDF